MAQLGRADLSRVQLKGTNLDRATLADLNGIGPGLADVQWDDTNLAVVDWSQVKILEDEYRAQHNIADWSRIRITENEYTAQHNPFSNVKNGLLRIENRSRRGVVRRVWSRKIPAILKGFEGQGPADASLLTFFAP